MINLIHYLFNYFFMELAVSSYLYFDIWASLWRVILNKKHHPVKLSHNSNEFLYATYIITINWLNCFTSIYKAKSSGRNWIFLVAKATEAFTAICNSVSESLWLFQGWLLFYTLYMQSPCWLHLNQNIY